MTKNTTIDLSTVGISTSQYDNCDITDLWTDETTHGYGGENQFATADLGLHGHVAYKIFCSPF